MALKFNPITQSFDMVGSSGGNPFNQSLNTTDDVKFSTINGGELSGDNTGDQTLPTATSDLTNDSGFITIGDVTPKQNYKTFYYSSDFTNANANTAQPFWLGAVIGSGALAVLTVPNSDIATVGCVSFTGALNGGYQFSTNITNMVLGGGEKTLTRFHCPTITTSEVRFGFMDSFGTGAITDGAWISITNGVLKGNTSKASSASATGTTYTISAGVSNTYSTNIVVNSDATRVDFYLYDISGNLLWTDYLTTNIPKSSSYQTGHGICAYRTASSATAPLALDFMDIEYTRAMLRYP